MRLLGVAKAGEEGRELVEGAHKARGAMRAIGGGGDSRRWGLQSAQERCLAQLMYKGDAKKGGPH